MRGFASLGRAAISERPDPLDGPLLPAQLPPPASGERWPWLQRLRRAPTLPLLPWLEAIEAGALEPRSDLLAVLVDHLDGPAAARLLAWWIASPQRDPEALALIARVRHPLCADLLRRTLEPALPPRSVPLPGPLDPDPHPDSDPALALLPLLGHQRRPADYPLLERCCLRPASAALRRAALEGLLLGLGAWPRPALRRTLSTLATDLDPRLASVAVDALARLPRARSALVPLSRRPLERGVAERLQRRLAALPPRDLLLVVHGRAGGVIPEELRTLAAELAERRGAPVHLRALTGPVPLPPVPTGGSGAAGSAAVNGPLLVPLFLLPGAHVRRDVPRIAAGRGSGQGRLPFLGAWPAWQRALAEEVAKLAEAGETARGAEAGEPPLLLHHPLEGPLGERYLAHLERISGARCLAAPYSSTDPEEFALELRGPVLPLALAANRLTDALGGRLGLPLLARPRFRHVLIEQLEALP